MVKQGEREFVRRVKSVWPTLLQFNVVSVISGKEKEPSTVCSKRLAWPTTTGRPTAGPGPSLPGEDLKVGILVLFFSFLSLYTTAHCFGKLTNCFSGTCVKEVLGADVDSISLNHSLNKRTYWSLKC